MADLDFFRTLPLAKSIMDDILSHPSSKILKNQYKCPQGGPKTKDPEKRESKTLSFDLILANLENNQYHTFQQWIYDCNLYFKTCTERCKKDPFLHVIVSNLQEQFKRKYEKIDVSNPINWGKKVHYYQDKIDRLLRAAPPLVQSHTPFLQIPESELIKLSLSQNDFIAKCSEKLKNPSDIMKVIRILGDDANYIRETDNVGTIEIKNMSQETLSRLFMFMSEKFS